MVIDDFDFMGAILVPHKAEAPLVIDPNAVLALPVPTECFQAVAGESLGDATDMAEFPVEKRASLSRTAPRWVPTSEVRGEGVFVQVAEIELL